MKVLQHEGTGELQVFCYDDCRRGFFGEKIILV